jgi:hypothetical protein
MNRSSQLTVQAVIPHRCRPPVQRFHETDHMPTNFQFVIPGRRSEAEANPESSNHRPGLLDAGFFDPRPSADGLAPE